MATCSELERPVKESESAAMLMALVAFAVLVCLAVCALLMWLVNLTVIRLQPGELKHHWGPIAYVLPRALSGYHIEPSSGAEDKAMHRQGSTLQLDDAPHTDHRATALNNHHGIEEISHDKRIAKSDLSNLGFTAVLADRNGHAGCRNRAYEISHTDVDSRIVSVRCAGDPGWIGCAGQSRSPALHYDI
jgi:hypothetical protein